MPSVSVTPAAARLCNDARIVGTVWRGCEPPLQTSVWFKASGYRLELRLPEHGDSESTDLRVVAHRALSNKLYIYARGDSVTTLPGLSFRAISRAKKTEIETFFAATRGMIFQYFDSWGEPHTGYVRTFQFTHVNRDRGYDLTVDFEEQ